MCCSYNKSATEQFRTELQQCPRTLYKVWAVEATGKIVAPLQETVVVVVDGVVASGRESSPVKDHEKTDGISSGIHVWTTLEAAEIQQLSGQIVVPVRIDIDDLVGCNGERTHAVFTKVRVDADELKRLADAAIASGNVSDPTDDWDDEDDNFDDDWDDDDEEEDDWDDDDFDDDDDEDWDDDEEDDDWDDE